MKDIQTAHTEYEAKYREETLRKIGREDGSKSVPRPDQKGLSPFESEITNSARMLASRVASDYQSQLETIDAEMKGLIDKAERQLKDDDKRIEESFNANKNLQEQSYPLRAARENFEQAKKRFDVMFSKTGRMPIHYVPHWLYVTFAFMIFVGEIPLNAMVFQIFGENQIMTWIMAFVIGLSIPLLAHFVGLKAREHSGKIHWPNLIKAIAMAALTVGALWGLSEMRHDYLQAMKDDLGLSEELVETSYLFLWLNVAVFAAATLLAYLSHDPVPGYDRLYLEYRKAQRKLSKEEDRLTQALKWLEMDRVNQHDRARGAYRENLGKVMELKGKYDKILIEGREHEERCLHLARRDISIYRHENLRSRSDQASPQCFSTEIDFPLVMRAMKEKLSNEAHA